MVQTVHPGLCTNSDLRQHIQLMVVVTTLVEVAKQPTCMNPITHKEILQLPIKKRLFVQHAPFIHVGCLVTSTKHV